MTASLFPEEAAGGEWVIAYCDGGSRGNPGPAGCGVYLTQPNGTPIAELSEYLGKRTNNYAEYSALLGALNWALENKRPRLRVIADSELMVKQMQGRYKVNSPDLRPLWEEARRRAAQLEGFRIEHVLRHKNKEADRLANEAMDRGTGRGARPSDSVAAEQQSTSSISSVARPAAQSRRIENRPAESRPTESKPVMLRGFVKGGVVHLLGAELPEGVFVKVIRE